LQFPAREIAKFVVASILREKQFYWSPDQPLDAVSGAIGCALDEDPLGGIGDVMCDRFSALGVQSQGTRQRFPPLPNLSVPEQGVILQDDATGAGIRVSVVVVL
jgi:hypothetical protein